MIDVELARGGIRDQPWGLTLGALAQRSITGEMTIVDGATRVVLVFDEGFLVAGTSTRQAPTLLERAARTFDLPNATYVLDDHPTLLRREPGAAVDLRQVIFTGAWRYLDDERLLRELRQLGTRYSLGPGAVAELPRFGSDAPVAIAESLREGASLAELESAHAEVDRRALQAFVYALVSCGTVRGLLPARAPTPPPEGRTITPGRTTTPNRTITPNRTVTPNRTITPKGTEPPNRTVTPQVVARIPTVNVARQPTPPGQPRATTPRDPMPARTATTKDAIPPMVTDEDVPVVRTTTTRDPVRRTTTTRDPVREIIRPSAVRRDEDDDLDLSRTTTRRDPEPAPLPPPPARGARAHPQPPRDEDTGRIRKATPARGTSFSTPSHGVKIIAPDDEARYRAGQAADRARRLLEAHEYGEATKEALAATRLQPDSFDHQALHAWATFCGAKDKTAVADATRKLLEKATHRASQPNDVRMMLGKLERVVGREREALRHFKTVLEREPRHAEATALVREIETQLEAFARR